MAVSNPHRLLDELVKLESLRDPKLEGGSRVYRRFVIRGEAEAVRLDRNAMDSSPQPILLRDVGRGGLGFVTQSPMEVYSTWRVGFVQTGYVYAQQAMIVRHCRMIRPDLYLVGAQFCIESGLLCLLGVDPADIADGDRPISEQSRYIPPAEVA